MYVAHTINRGILTKEKLLSFFDKKYTSRYQQFLVEVQKKIDLIVKDSQTFCEQTMKAHSVSTTSIFFAISFEQEISHFFSWADKYPWSKMHIFLGYYDIDLILKSRNLSYEWNNNEVQCSFLATKN